MRSGFDSESERVTPCENGLGQGPVIGIGDDTDRAWREAVVSGIAQRLDGLLVAELHGLDAVAGGRAAPQRLNRQSPSLRCAREG